MKKLTLVAICCLVANTAVKAQDKILIAGSGWDKVGLVDINSGKLEWDFPLLKGEDCNDIECTTDGNILLGCMTSARLVGWDKSVVWDYLCKANEEIYTATELRGTLAKEFGGKYLLAICGKPSRFVVLNRKGKTVREIVFESGVDNVHGQFRQVLPIEGGKFLLPLMDKGEVLEIDNSGKILKRVNVGGNPFSVKVLETGMWAVACGDGHSIAFVDPKSEKVVHSIGENDIKGVQLLFVSEFEPQVDGAIMTNWNGHSSDKSQPKLFKIDSDSKLVWSLPASNEIANISALYPLKPKK